MTPFPDYKTATNAAYDLLTQMNTFSVQTDVFGIIHSLPNCRMYSYGLTDYYFPDSMGTLLERSEFGFSIVQKDRRIIYYNEENSFATIRFTLAHELGHAVLNHREEDNPQSEKEANCFARNLLCPLPISDELKAHTPEEYAALFNVSHQMAAVTVARRSSDAYYMDEKYRKQIITMYRRSLVEYDMAMRYLGIITDRSIPA